MFYIKCFCKYIFNCIVDLVFLYCVLFTGSESFGNQHNPIIETQAFLTVKAGMQFLKFVQELAFR